MFSASLEIHEEEVRHLLDILKLRNIKTSFDISQLVTERFVFLGNKIERGEIKILPTRASGLQNLKTPKNLAELQRLLGMSNYNRAYIPKYAELAKPLYDLIDLKGVPDNCKKKNGAENGNKIAIEWNPLAIEALNTLIEIMSSELV